jgi:hypothetical protein
VRHPRRQEVVPLPRQGETLTPEQEQDRSTRLYQGLRGWAQVQQYLEGVEIARIEVSC